MKKNLMKMMTIIFVSSIVLTSCYSYDIVVGNGAQGNQKVSKWNHYVVYGLAPVDVSDVKELASGAENYDVNISHSFVNGLVSMITFGLYSPTTTTVYK